MTTTTSKLLSLTRQALVLIHLSLLLALGWPQLCLCLSIPIQTCFLSGYSIPQKREFPSLNLFPPLQMHLFGKNIINKKTLHLKRVRFHLLSGRPESVKRPGSAQACRALEAWAGEKHVSRGLKKAKAFSCPNCPGLQVLPVHRRLFSQHVTWDGMACVLRKARTMHKCYWM